MTWKKVKYNWFYSSPADVNEKEEDAIDPRWEKLKKLK